MSIQIDTERTSLKNSNPTGGKKWLHRYIDRIGIRSAIFQGLIVPWTVFCAFWIARLYFFGVWNLGSESPEITEAMKAYYLHDAWIGVGFWALVAVPLGIAAIATLETRKEISIEGNQ